MLLFAGPLILGYNLFEANILLQKFSLTAYLLINKRELIKFVQKPDEPIIKGLYLSFGMFFFSVITSSILQQFQGRMFALGSMIRMAVVNLIYKKVYYLFKN